MTDLEIDRSLALAIGWRKTCESTKTFWVVEDSGNRRVFTHKDWNVIGPIAARYDCFPFRLRGVAWEAISRGKYKLAFFNADTPQKAIALAVIGALK